jgi:hypothetical protein
LINRLLREGDLQENWYIEVKEVDVAFHACLDQHWRSRWSLSADILAKRAFDPE